MGQLDAIITSDGLVTIAKLSSPYGTYRLVLDENGVELARTLNTRKVVVVGTVVGGSKREKLLLVKTYGEYQDTTPTGP